MTIFEDPLFQKYISLSTMEDEMRHSFVRWMNTQIPHFDLGSSIKDLIEVTRVTYVHDRFGSEIMKEVSMNPYAILNILVKTELGFKDTIRRISLDKFGTMREKLLEEFQYFINFRQFHYGVCNEINEKYMNKIATDGKSKHNITRIEYYKFPIFYSKPNLLEKRINPKEFSLL